MTNVDAIFRVWGGCANKINDASLPDGNFLCPLIAHVIKATVVRYDTDAMDCVRERHYRCLGNDNAYVELYKD